MFIPFIDKSWQIPLQKPCFSLHGNFHIIVTIEWGWFILRGMGLFINIPMILPIKNQFSQICFHHFLHHFLQTPLQPLQPLCSSAVMRHSSSRRRCNDDRCAASASARPSVCAWEEARPLKRSSCNLGPPGAPWGALGPWDVSKQKNGWKGWKNHGKSAKWWVVSTGKTMVR